METPTCIEGNTRIHEIYTNKEEEFMDGKVSIRTLVHVKDKSTFVQHIITE